MRYAVDVDNTLLLTNGDYTLSTPIQHRVDAVNRLFDEGHHITLFTARGQRSGKDYSELTKQQMETFGVKHHRLLFGKPDADVFIDDKALNVVDWDTQLQQGCVWTNGCFDVLHVGHIKMLEFCAVEAVRLNCKLVVGVDSDRRVKAAKGSSRPVNCLEDRMAFLAAIKGVSKVVSFDSSEELTNLLAELRPKLMVVGLEYETKEVVGSMHAESIAFFPRYKDHSTTQLLEKGKENAAG